MKNRAFRFAVPVLLGAAAIAFAAVQTDYDRKVDFSRYRTYSWIDVKSGNPLWEDRIRTAVDRQLMAKGWTQVPSDGDAAVAAFGKTTERDTLETFYTGYPGWGWQHWGGTGTAITRVVPERIGNLTVDIFDGTTKQLIWRGTATKTLSSKPEKNIDKLNDAARDMFKQFPPASRT